MVRPGTVLARGRRPPVNLAQGSRRALARLYVRFVTQLGRYRLVRRLVFRRIGYSLGARARRFLTAGSPRVVRLPHGFVMLVDPDDPYAVLWLSGSYEPGVTKLIKDLLKPGAGFVDVGAHEGYYSLLASQLVGSAGHVFAFEPEPFNFARLSENVALNNPTNVTTVPLAAGGYTGRAVLHTGGLGSGSHSLAPNVDTVGQVEVELTTLDAYFQEQGWPKVDFVKMDVEGAEMAVLSGMRMLMRRNPNLNVVLEFFPRALTAMGLDPRAACSELEDLFEEIWRIDDRKGMVVVDADAMVDRWDSQLNADNLWARAPRVDLAQTAPGADGVGQCAP